uniref:Uncharacterized protein n=1 Tax=Romanomermis culicivorax TaxID=13658 RepID=A0A915JZ08_ROMCU
MINAAIEITKAVLINLKSLKRVIIKEAVSSRKSLLKMKVWPRHRASIISKWSIVIRDGEMPLIDISKAPRTCVLRRHLENHQRGYAAKVYDYNPET